MGGHPLTPLAEATSPPRQPRKCSASGVNLDPVVKTEPGKSRRIAEGIGAHDGVSHDRDAFVKKKHSSCSPPRRRAIGRVRSRMDPMPTMPGDRLFDRRPVTSLRGRGLPDSRPALPASYDLPPRWRPWVVLTSISARARSYHNSLARGRDQLSRLVFASPGPSPAR
jgi:hypothetical protein